MSKPREFWIPWYYGGFKANPEKVFMCSIHDKDPTKFGRILHENAELFIEKLAYDKAVEALKSIAAVHSQWDEQFPDKMDRGAMIAVLDTDTLLCRQTLKELGEL